MTATVEQKREFQSTLRKFKTEIDNITKDISLMQKAAKEKTNITEYIKIGIAIEHLKIIGNYLAISDISNEILAIKNENYLNNARKEIYKILQILEEVVSKMPDLTLNENQEMIQKIKHMNPMHKINLLRGLKLATINMIERFGPGTKWKWSFQEIHSRTAIIGKNITDWREVEGNRDPRKPHYQTIINLAKWVKDELFFAAQEFKKKYDQNEVKVESDLKQIIILFESLYKIHNTFGEREAAERIKTLTEATKEILESALAGKEKKDDKAKDDKKKKKK